LPTPPPDVSNSHSGSEPESSEEEDIFLTDEETSPWEPPVPHTTTTGPNPPSDTELDPPPPASPSNDVRERAWVKPKVVQFPDPRAGEPVGSAPPTHNVYATSLGNPSPSNPYSPFASKIDWEVAQWAKLHGPSCTSFADLLKIDTGGRGAKAQRANCDLFLIF